MDKSIAIPSCLVQAKAIETISASRSSPVVSISAASTGYLYKLSKSSLSDPCCYPYAEELISTAVPVPAIALMPNVIN